MTAGADRPLTEVEVAYLAICEDMVLWGTPAGIDYSHGSVCEIIRHAIGLIGVGGNDTLPEAAVYLLRETRRRHPAVVPVGIINARDRH